MPGKQHRDVKYILFSAMIGAVALASGTALWAEDIHLGQIEYEIACMSCHGIDGKGDGVAGEKLVNRPSDLTRIMHRNNGVFPEDHLARIIDGRTVIDGHGQREMPIWGKRYSIAVEEGEDTAEIDARVRRRIAALVTYIRELQVP